MYSTESLVAANGKGHQFYLFETDQSAQPNNNEVLGFASVSNESSWRFQIKQIIHHTLGA
jgi:hypothetical protein